MATKKKKVTKKREPVTATSELEVAVEKATKKPSSSTTKQRLRAFENRINKRSNYTNAVTAAENAPNTYFLRRPTGIMPLDLHLAGGFPSGGVNYLSGPPNAGKTYVLFKTYAMHQKLYGDRAIIGHGQLEGGFDYWYARRAGVKVAIPTPEVEMRRDWRNERGLPDFTKEELVAFKEQVGEFVLFREATGEKMLDNFHDAIVLNEFRIIGLDSVSALLPASEAGLATLEKFGQQAAQASMLTRFLSRTGPHFIGLDGVVNETTLIFISHVRANRHKQELMSHLQKYEKDWAATGAWAAKHFKLIDVTFWQGSKISEGNKDTAKTKVGHSLKWKIEKGKAGARDGQTGEIEFFHELPSGETGVDNIGSIIASGLRFGVVREQEGRVSIVRPETGGVFEDMKNIPTMADLRDLLASDFEIEYAVRREILAAANKPCRWR